MDPLHLLTRSSRSSGPRTNARLQQSLPSGGAVHNPQLFGLATDSSASQANARKRKRGAEGAIELASTPVPNFFGERTEEKAVTVSDEAAVEHRNVPVAASATKKEAHMPIMNEEERKRILRQHKLKITVLYEPVTTADSLSLDDKASRRQSKRKDKLEEGKAKSTGKHRQLFPRPVTHYADLQAFGISRALADNIHEQGYRIPTEVQMAALPFLLGGLHEDVGTGTTSAKDARAMPIDLLTVAPTGSGKTLAFMIPLLSALAQSRRKSDNKAKTPQAIILAPTKELAMQITNEGRKLASNTGIHITNVRKGMHLDHGDSAKGSELEHATPPVKADILVSTPLTMVHAIGDSKAAETGLRDVRFLVLDEADVLLDPLFKEQTLSIWNAVPNQDLRVSLWSATMGSNIEQLAEQVMNSRAAHLSASTGQACTRAPLIRLVVGLKDSAVPNIDHQLIYAASEQGKLMALRQLLHPTTARDATRPALRAPFLIFTQTISRAVALHSELLYDIPPEAGGIARIAVLHSDLSDTARDSVMARFRSGTVWVLITTDLLARGVDFRGVNAVVNYDVPGSGAAYVHRVGRTGRAGRAGGVAVTLYTRDDVPYVKNVANVIAASQKLAGAAAAGAGTGSGVQQWLLDALPTPSKRDKQQLKKRGVEARRSGGGAGAGGAATNAVDKKAAAKARISTKSGFVRRMENNRKGAIAAARRTGVEDMEVGQNGSDSEFAGFDE